MSFAILGTIGTAIGTGLSAISGGIAAGATALGASAGVASALGTIGTGALVGSGLGAAGSAITGGDPGEGAAMGALGGAATGGLGSLFGSGAGAAGSAAGNAAGNFGGLGANAMNPALGQAFNASNVMGANSLLAAAPSSAATSLTGNIGEQLVQGIGSGIGSSGLQSAGSGILGAVPSAITDFAKEQVPGMLVDTASSVLSPGAGGRGPSMTDMNVKDYIENRDARQLSNQQYGRGLGGGPLGSKFAGGGEVNLEDGQFILPSDVVSALGNGSTKAGAQFLDEFFGLT